MKTPAESAPAGTQAVQRTLALLDALTPRQAPVALSELASITAIPKSTVHRLLATLIAKGYVCQNSSGAYHLGESAARLGRAAQYFKPMASAITESLDRIATASGDTAFCTERQGTLGVCTARREGTGPIRNVVLHPGDRHPLGIGAGALAVLAALPQTEQERVRRQNLLAFPTDSAIAHRERDGSLNRALKQARHDGYAINPGMLEPSSWAIAVAFRDQAGEVLGALSIASIKDRLGKERHPRLIRLLKGEVQAIETEMRSRPSSPNTSERNP